MQNDMCTIRFSVKDKGIGMTDEEQSKLFNIFQQAEASTSRKFGGSGLGLSISKHLIEMMDGEIWVTSEKGQGSEFIFDVKLKMSDENAVIAQNEDTISLETDFSGKTVMVVDDVLINLEIAEALLSSLDLEVVTVADAKESIELFTQNPSRFDLIFMDVQMPEIDGLEATEMIRALDIKEAATIPIIAMTANVFKEDIERCLASGMNGHLGKPIDMTEVVKVLVKTFQQ